MFDTFRLLVRTHVDVIAAVFRSDIEYRGSLYAQASDKKDKCNEDLFQPAGHNVLSTIIVAFAL